jgi:hypothetical protein
MKTTTPACLLPKCKKAPKCRGLCPGHYAVALKLVRMQKITWAELEAAGKCKPPGHPKTGHIQEWFLAAKAK